MKDMIVQKKNVQEEGALSESAKNAAQQKINMRQKMAVKLNFPPNFFAAFLNTKATQFFLGKIKIECIVFISMAFTLK